MSETQLNCEDLEKNLKAIDELIEETLSDKTTSTEYKKLTKKFFEMQKKYIAFWCKYTKISDSLIYAQDESKGNETEMLFSIIFHLYMELNKIKKEINTLEMIGALTGLVNKFGEKEKKEQQASH